MRDAYVAAGGVDDGELTSSGGVQVIGEQRTFGAVPRENGLTEGVPGQDGAGGQLDARRAGGVAGGPEGPADAAVLGEVLIVVELEVRGDRCFQPTHDTRGQHPAEGPPRGHVQLATGAQRAGIGMVERSIVWACV
ncbi:hypothetical protein ACIRQP_14315 [Streptomyces sp. NPDC102274]|uniref:hypothetical protein n=1 Tax=Streptomyces sp. NPDC102274 TaxID=3366151 RepID=UPI003819117F